MMMTITKTIIVTIIAIIMTQMYMIQRAVIMQRNAV